MRVLVRGGADTERATAGGWSPVGLAIKGNDNDRGRSLAGVEPAGGEDEDVEDTVHQLMPWGMDKTRASELVKLIHSRWPERTDTQSRYGHGTSKMNVRKALLEIVQNRTT